MFSFVTAIPPPCRVDLDALLLFCRMSTATSAREWIRLVRLHLHAAKGRGVAGDDCTRPWCATANCLVPYCRPGRVHQRVVVLLLSRPWDPRTLVLIAARVVSSITREVKPCQKSNSSLSHSIMAASSSCCYLLRSFFRTSETAVSLSVTYSSL